MSEQGGTCTNHAWFSSLHPKSRELSCKIPASTQFNFLSPKLTFQPCKQREVFKNVYYTLFLLKTEHDRKTDDIIEFSVKNMQKKDTEKFTWDKNRVYQPIFLNNLLKCICIHF
jgi:hypothetical protein